MTVSFDDANGDGLIDATEYAVDTALTFLGNALPTREASLNTSITLFNNRVRIGSQFDYRGGHIIDNSIENYRCYVGNCRAWSTAPPRLKNRRWLRPHMAGSPVRWSLTSPGGSSRCGSSR